MASPPTPYCTHPNAVIAIMAKAPVAGRVKTRMQPQLTEAESATLQANLIAHTIHTCLTSYIAPVQLWCAPVTEHPCFLNYEAYVELHTQVHGDLGERMAQVFKQQNDKKFILIVGTDCPLLTHQHLAIASQTLAGKDVVLQPATDGGYVLIGGQTTPLCFENIDWGTDQVLEQSTQALKSAGQSFTLLEKTSDLDDNDDFCALPSALRKKLLTPNPFVI